MTTKQEHLEACGARPYIPSAAVKQRQRGKTALILKRLAEADDWVSTAELVLINHRFSASIHALRMAGHVIEDRRDEKTGVFQWKYIKRVPAFHVSEHWKQLYYQSAHWREIRATRLDFDFHRCCNCHSMAELEVHHWRYDLFEEQLGDLMTFCRVCHERIHHSVNIKFPRVIPEHIYYRLVLPVNPAA